MSKTVTSSNLNHTIVESTVVWPPPACTRCVKLLEALKELVDAEWMVTHDWGGDRQAVLEKARAAIAEAEGE